MIQMLGYKMDIYASLLPHLVLMGTFFVIQLLCRKIAL